MLMFANRISWMSWSPDAPPTARRLVKNRLKFV
jgi:hypothetical protein